MSTLKTVGRRERKKAEKLRRIEAAARALFREQGYQATTTRAIAERADIAAGTLFTYFPEKRLLLVHIVRADLDEAIAAALATMPEGDPVEALMHVFTAIYRSYERDRELARVFVKELLFLDGELGTDAGAWTVDFITRLGGLFARWQKEGRVAAHVEPATAGFQVFALYYFGLVSWLGSAPVTPELRDTMLRASLQQTMRGLAPEGGTP